MPVPRRLSSSLLLLPLLLVAALSLTGCIRSRVHITSEPSGAEVVWLGKPYGATPVTIPYVWYWHYDVKVTKPGYQSVEAMERFRTPPWFVMPLDLFMEILPIPIPDNRYRHYELEPVETSQASLMDKAKPASADETTTATASVAHP